MNRREEEEGYDLGKDIIHIERPPSKPKKPNKPKPTPYN